MMTFRTDNEKGAAWAAPFFGLESRSEPLIDGQAISGPIWGFEALKMQENPAKPQINHA
jgi:hypothetical protein